MALQALFFQAHDFMPVETTAFLQILAPRAVYVLQLVSKFLHYPVQAQPVFNPQASEPWKSPQATVSEQP